MRHLLVAAFLVAAARPPKLAFERVNETKDRARYRGCSVTYTRSEVTRDDVQLFADTYLQKSCDGGKGGPMMLMKADSELAIYATFAVNDPSWIHDQDLIDELHGDARRLAVAFKTKFCFALFAPVSTKVVSKVCELPPGPPPETSRI